MLARCILAYKYQLTCLLFPCVLHALCDSNWWNDTSRKGAGPLHAINPVRVGFIRNALAQKLGTSHLFASKQIAGLKILDVGCGGGLLAESLSRLGARVTAIDPSPENIQAAIAHSKLDHLTASIDYRHSVVGKVFSREFCDHYVTM